MSGKGLNRLQANIAGMVIFGILMLTCLVIVLTIGGFFCVSMKQAVHNMTTLESIGGTVLFAGGSKETYDLGSWLLNLRELFGPVFIAWFLPIQSTPGDGMTFPVRSEIAEGREPLDSRPKSDNPVASELAIASGSGAMS